MKTFSKLFAVLALLLSVILPTVVKAADVQPTNVTIHKIETDEGVKDYPNADGSALTPQQYADAFGADAKPVSGVTFTYFSVTAAQLKDMNAAPANYKTAAQVAAYVGNEGTTTAATGANGEVAVNGLAAGNYWFVENQSAVITDAKAVPFGLTLPIYNLTDNTQITDLHVYPKNVLADTPTIDKDVTVDTNKDDSFNIGEEITWLIQPTIPTGIEDYKTYRVTDKLDSKLDFQSVSVTGLTEGVDYTVTAPAAGTAGAEIVIDFTAAGREKLAELAEAGATAAEIKLVTTINDTAIMGQDIPNNATLDFDNGHGTYTDKGKDPSTPDNPDGPTDTPDVPEDDQPKVYTGGKRFVKEDSADQTKLAGAEFVISKDANGAADSFLQADGSWGAEATAKVFTSDADGAFEVKGLAYGSTGDVNDGTQSATYYLKETKAPAGYVLPSALIAFEVNKTSYYTDPTTVTVGTQEGDATQQVVGNQKNPSIPNTGGIGSLIFITSGLALMALAVVGLKRRQAAE